MDYLRAANARTDLESLKQTAAQLSLDDPAALLQDLGWITGRVTALRAFAKRQAAERKSTGQG